MTKVHVYKREWLLFLPLFGLLIFVMIFPTFYTFLLSFSRFSLLGNKLVLSGLKNYSSLINDEEFWVSLKNSVLFTGITVPFELVLGLFLALWLNRQFRGKYLVRAALLLPWAIPTALNAVVWRWMYNTDYGIFNDLLLRVGLIRAGINWLGQIPLAMISMMIVAIWKTSSFMALILLAGLQSIPNEVYEAALIDGSTKWTTFKSITLPLLKPAILVSLLFRTMDAFRSFDLPFNLTQGGPVNSTETLSLYAYKVSFQFLKFDYAASVIIVQFAILLVLSILYLRFLEVEL
ncbi:sugar ABC transporter permease [Thermatribacter velox]|uniref:Sugar ABC transporter permease n=2 Tax=Atribacterales TaxID=2847775 RepID=A0ABZ2YE41_9BACT|nr:trehalose/maltose transport system permease protein [Candidatus Atribacteria bacterium]